MLNIGIVVAARMGSNRLPRKAMLPLGQDPMLLFLLKRLSKSIFSSKIVLATTNLKEDEELASIAAKHGIECVRGSSEDVVHRYIEVALKYKFNYIVRVTADCPFVDGNILDQFIEKTFSQNKTPILSSTKGKFPIGIDFELYNCERLQHLHDQNKLTKEDREHLTKYFYDHSDLFPVEYIEPPIYWPKVVETFTIDTPKDYDFAKKIYNHFQQNNFSVEELLMYVSTDIKSVLC